jgi:hypothetical protein
MNGYDTNLAAEFHVLSILHRLGMSATLTLGNKKSVDIVVTRDVGDTFTIDVKGLAGTTNWPIDNLRVRKKNHFIIFVTFLGKISDPSVIPDVYIVPSEKIPDYDKTDENCVVYENPGETRRVIPVGRAKKLWQEFKGAWELLR